MAEQLEALIRRLRARLCEPGELAIDSADLRLLLDEVGRLRQSSDRLRRQNRRLRLRLDRAGLVADLPDDTAEPGAGP